MFADNKIAICYRLNGFADISLSARNAAAFIESLCLVRMRKGETRRK